MGQYKSTAKLLWPWVLSKLKYMDDFSPFHRVFFEMNVKAVKLEFTGTAYTAIGVHWRDGSESLLMFAHGEDAPGASHEIRIGGVAYRWDGPYRWVQARD